MTPKATAEKLARQTAMKCTGSIIDDTKAILSTIPIVEYEECVEALRAMRLAVTNDGFEPVCNNPLSESAFTHSTIKMESALAILTAKLNEKGQP